MIRDAYVLPDLPEATYEVFVRGYGLVDSPRVSASPGQMLDIEGVVASDARAAAQVYPAAWWLSMIELPEGELSAAWVPYLVSGVLAVFFALQLVDAGFGLSLKDLMGRLEGGLAGWLEEKMMWLRPLEEDDPALGARDALLPSANILTALPPATHTGQQDAGG